MQMHQQLVSTYNYTFILGFYEFFNESIFKKCADVL